MGQATISGEGDQAVYSLILTKGYEENKGLFTLNTGERSISVVFENKLVLRLFISRRKEQDARRKLEQLEQEREQDKQKIAALEKSQDKRIVLHCNPSSIKSPQVEKLKYQG